MRFLCLAGTGNNAAILEWQLSAIVRQLEGSHDFVYIDGDFESAPSDGAERFFSGPYYTFWEAPTSEQVKSAVDLITDVIQDDGPFDVLIGFSQGAAVAATYLIRNPQASKPQHSIKCAIFFNSIMPFDPDSRTFTIKSDGCCWDDTDNEPVDFDLRRIYPEFGEHYPDVTRLTDVAEGLCQRYDQKAGTLIDIPTMHVLSERDRLYFEQGQCLLSLCDPRSRELIQHGDGHAIPKDNITVGKIVRGIESLLRQAITA